MKKILALLLICFAQIVFSQHKEEIKNKPACAGERIYKNDSKNNIIKPEFPGGIEKFYSFIKENYKKPKVKNLSGRIYMSFYIEKDGSLTNIKIIRDIGYGTGKEAIRVLKKSPKWIPGKQNGKPVRVLYPIPITIN